MRESGYYWVRWLPTEADWKVAYFDGERWQINGGVLGSSVTNGDARLEIDERRIFRAA